MFYILSGLALGMILLNSAAAIVLSFMLPTVFSILVNVISWLEEAAPWIDKNTAMQDFLVEDADVNGPTGRTSRSRPCGGLDTAAARRLPGDPQRGEVTLTGRLNARPWSRGGI